MAGMISAAPMPSRRDHPMSSTGNDEATPVTSDPIP